ncbi:hypothetical protein D3C75_1195370 [compost metagenome]
MYSQHFKGLSRVLGCLLNVIKREQTQIALRLMKKMIDIALYFTVLLLYTDERPLLKTNVGS